MYSDASENESFPKQAGQITAKEHHCVLASFHIVRNVCVCVCVHVLSVNVMSEYIYKLV